MIEYDNFFNLLIAFGFVLLNAFFVMAEFSLVKLRHSQALILKKTQGIRGRVLYKVHSNLDIYLSACQLGITLASLGLGWIGEPAFSKLLEPLFAILGITSIKLIKLISFVTGFAIISFLHIVIGELMPKSMAMSQAKKLSLFTCIPLYVFYWAMFPFIWILNFSARMLLKVCRLNSPADAEHGYSIEEIKLILKSTSLKKPLREEHRDILLKIVAFSRLQAIDAMHPINEMVSINYETSNMDKLKTIKEFLYTRYPVYKDSPNNIVGIIHTKDILCALDDDLNSNERILRPVLKVSYHDQLIDVLKNFQQGKPHFAIVYKKDLPIGFITLDNLLAILIGKISDEFHLVKEPWITLDPNKFMIKADAPVYAIEKLAEVDLSKYPADTVLDIMQQILGNNLVVGDTWDQPEFLIKVSKVKNNTVKEITLEKKEILDDSEIQKL